MHPPAACSIKLIHKGRIITDEPELRSLVEKQATFVFLSRRQPPLSPRCDFQLLGIAALAVSHPYSIHKFTQQFAIV